MHTWRPSSRWDCWPFSEARRRPMGVAPAASPDDRRASGRRGRAFAAWSRTGGVWRGAVRVVVSDGAGRRGRLLMMRPTALRRHGAASQTKPPLGTGMTCPQSGQGLDGERQTDYPRVAHWGCDAGGIVAVVDSAVVVAIGRPRFPPSSSAAATGWGGRAGSALAGRARPRPRVAGLAEPSLQAQARPTIRCVPREVDEDLGRRENWRYKQNEGGGQQG